MQKEVIFGHSPDSDDAFMYYGIASGNVKLDNFKISHLMEDIESLNIRSEKGELDVTAISVAHAKALVCLTTFPNGSPEIIRGTRRPPSPA